MRVSDLISRLTESYSPDDEIVVEWWDRRTVQDFAGADLTDDEWSTLVAVYEDREFGWQTHAMDSMYDLVGEVHEDGPEDEE